MTAAGIWRVTGSIGVSARVRHNHDGTKFIRTTVELRLTVKRFSDTIEMAADNGTTETTDGIVTGTVTQDGKATEIKNGTLDGLKLKFETRHAATGGGVPMTMSWTGTIINDGEAQAINLTCAMQTEDGGPAVGDLQAQQMEARRVR